LETPEPVTPAVNPERSPSAFSVPKLPSTQSTPTPACLPSSYRSSIPVAYANLRAATADNRWKAPQHYINTQRGGQLRRQGAFYGTPDWSTMTEISSAVPDSGAPLPSPPASPPIEEVISTVGNSRGGQLRRQGAFYVTPDCSTMTAISSAVPDSGAPLPSPPASPPIEEVISTVGNSRGGQLRRQGAFYGTPDCSTMTAISSAVPDSGAPLPSPPASPLIEEVISTVGNSRADVHTPVKVTQETDAAADAVEATISNKGDKVSDASSRNSCKRCRDPDEQEARKTANRMNISSIVHTAPDESSPSGLFSFCTGPSPARGDSSNRDDPPKRRRTSRDIVESDVVSDAKRPVRRSSRRG
jgi:hypothetical protein